MDKIKITRSLKGGEVTIEQGNQARWFDLSTADLYDLSVKLDKFLDNVSIAKKDESSQVAVPEWYYDYVQNAVQTSGRGQAVHNLWRHDYSDASPLTTSDQKNWLYANKLLATQAIVNGCRIEKMILVTIGYKDGATIQQVEVPEEEALKIEKMLADAAKK